MRNYACLPILLLLAVASRADDEAFGLRPGVLLLRNGSIISGNILHAGDRYDVGLKDGDLHVRAGDVEFAGPDLQSCYEHRRQGIDETRAQDHIELAEWCLRNGMQSAAGGELRQAMICDPSHPKIALVERRLVLAATQTNAELPAKTGSTGLPSAEELDRLVRGMPVGAVETFSSTVQPLLLNHCSTAACHGPTSSSSLKLMRVASHRTQSRRATQRNLHAVLGTIDTEHPNDSPLLQLPTRQHGTSRAAVFTNREALQYKQLVDWVHLVANKPKPAKNEEPESNDWPLEDGFDGTPPSKDATNPTIAARFLDPIPGSQSSGASELLEAAKSAARERNARQEVDALESDPSLVDPRAPKRLFTRRTPGNGPTRSKPKVGELPKTSEPADPFDPAQFNEKYFGGENRADSPQQ